MLDHPINEPITLEPHDPKWIKAYNTESRRLSNILSAVKHDIEHFGSTAVPGLLAKPIIDILIGIDFIPPTQTITWALVQCGYDYFGEAGVPGRYYYRRRGDKNFNLAVVQRKGELWRNNLFIRDYLTQHKDVAAEYAKLKQQIVQSGVTNLVEYSKRKADFLDSILKKMSR